MAAPARTFETPYPIIDQDPHAFRIVRYFRLSDYGVVAGGTLAFPTALYLWERIDPTRSRLRTGGRLGAVLGFIGGFLAAYQRSSARFWGWRENEREQSRDFAELSELARQGKPLYGESPQPEGIQSVAYRNSLFSQLKFQAIPWFNLVNHPYHGTDPSKYGSKAEEKSN